jgi:hypothetical protein
VSSSKSGPRTVNSVGKTHFGKWYLYTTAEKEDCWKKAVVDDDQGIMVPDSYIRLIRFNMDVPNQKYGYSIFFCGEARFLTEHFQKFQPAYENYQSRLEFDSIQAAKDYIDRFIERLNNLIAFI